MNVKQTLVRAIRTFVQTTLGVWLAGQVAPESISQLANLELLDAAVAAGIVGAVSFVQNALEEWRAVSYDRG